MIFVGDEKVNDAGGLMREWMSLIVKELAKPELGNIADCFREVF